MQIPPITIEEVANQFKVWRQNKSNKFEPIPPHLKDLVKQLLSSYSISQLAVALHISRSALYNIQKGQNCSSISNNQQTSKTESLNFIPVNFTDLNQTAKNQSINHDSSLNLTCEIIKPSGAKLIIHSTDISTIIQAFLCYN